MKKDNNGWQVKSLGEVVTDIRYGMNASADFINEGIKFLRVTDITTNGSVNYSKLPNVVANLKEVEKYFLKEGDCVIARSGSVGKAHIFNGLENVVFASYLIRLKFNKEMLYPNYFGAFSQTKSYWDQILSNTKGGVQQNINTEGLSRIKIPLPPLPIQKQIAEILEKADEAKQKRSEANKLTDEFLQSVFIEMFGDPVKNPKGWNVERVINRCDCIVPGRDKPKSFTGTIPWITTDDLIRLNRTSISKKRLGLNISEIKEVRARIIPKESVLLTCVGDLGLISIANGDMVINQQLHSFQCSDTLNNVFLMFCLSFQKSYMYKMATSTTVPYMNKSTCNSIPIIFPPFSLQQQFAEIVNKTEALKEKQKQSEQELENLFQSLMQKAFKGELVT